MVVVELCRGVTDELSKARHARASSRCSSFHLRPQLHHHHDTIAIPNHPPLTPPPPSHTAAIILADTHTDTGVTDNGMRHLHINSR